MIRLTTERLIVRDPSSTDFEDWHRLMSDPYTMYYLQNIMTRSAEESRLNLDDAIAEAHNPDRKKYFFTVEDKATGMFIGTVGYTATQTTPVGIIAHAGYFILPEYHGRGYTTEAFREIIRFAFVDGDVFRLETGCFRENGASERVMIKCGMIKEADRKAAAWHDGRMKDRVNYRLLREEWVSRDKGTIFILETKRLILRELTIDDLPATQAIVCDEQTMHAWNGAWSEEENRKQIHKQIRGYREEGFGRWAVVLKETGTVIGICGLQRCDTDQDSVLEIGYLFNRAYWHSGYAAEAAIACKQYAFDTLGFDEVFSLVRDTNIASMNVAIRNGMLVRRRYTKIYKGVDMPHYVFSVKKNDKEVPNHALRVGL